MLASARSITPAAREALEAYVKNVDAASAAVAEPAGGGLLSRWRGRSPAPRADRAEGASRGRAAAQALLASDEMLRAAHAEGKSPAAIRAATTNVRTTDDARAFVDGWLSSPSKDVAGRYHDAHVARHRARDPLAAFDAALADVDPGLAARGHTELLMSGQHPRAANAYLHLQAHLEHTASEDWKQSSRELVASVLHGA